MKLVIFFTSVILTLFSCHNKKTESTSKEKTVDWKSLSEFKETEFIPTLENKISKDKNAMYSVSLLFAWNEIKRELNSNFQISDECKDLVLVNSSKSYINTLNSKEYKTKVEINHDTINAYAEFSKSLPFEIELIDFNGALTFDNTKVKSFGLYGDSYELKKLIEIAFYKNDDNFIIKLLPKDKLHQIILFKSENRFSSMAEIFDEISRLTKIGDLERKNEKLQWKYNIDYGDIVIIPKFDFKIESNFKSLTSSEFKANNRFYAIRKAIQRTAFRLDETGSKIESESEIETFVVEEVEDEKPHPKKMIFNKPFFLVLKKTKSQNPYFGLWTTNSELMIKE